jgi:hypothetical protein
MDSIGERPRAFTTSVDEVQDLIRRTEEILDTLKQLGDTSYYRLRLKLNENVSLVRDKLVDRTELPEDGSGLGGQGMMRLTVARFSIATLTAFVIGLAVARLCDSD